MTRQDKILHLVLTDNHLMTKHGISPEDYRTLQEALVSENPIVVSIAMIIDSIKDNFEESDIKQLYICIQKHLNDNILL